MRHATQAAFTKGVVVIPKSVPEAAQDFLSQCFVRASDRPSLEKLAVHPFVTGAVPVPSLISLLWTLPPGASITHSPLKALRPLLEALGFPWPSVVEAISRNSLSPTTAAYYILLVALQTTDKLPQLPAQTAKDILPPIARENSAQALLTDTRTTDKVTSWLLELPSPKAENLEPPTPFKDFEKDSPTDFGFLPQPQELAEIVPSFFEHTVPEKPEPLLVSRSAEITSNFLAAPVVESSSTLPTFSFRRSAASSKMSYSNRTAPISTSFKLPTEPSPITSPKPNSKISPSPRRKFHTIAHTDVSAFREQGSLSRQLSKEFHPPTTTMPQPPASNVTPEEVMEALEGLPGASRRRSLSVPINTDKTSKPPSLFPTSQCPTRSPSNSSVPSFSMVTSTDRTPRSSTLPSVSRLPPSDDPRSCRVTHTPVLPPPPPVPRAPKRGTRHSVYRRSLF